MMFVQDWAVPVVTEVPEVPEVDEVGKVLLAAADYLDVHGWHQGGMGPRCGGPVCALGAIHNLDMPRETKMAAHKRLTRFVRCTVWKWNDVPGRTAAEVTAAMRAAARWCP